MYIYFLHYVPTIYIREERIKVWSNRKVMLLEFKDENRKRKKHDSKFPESMKTNYMRDRYVCCTRSKKL